MDSQLIESIAEATDLPLGRLDGLQLKADNFLHRVRQSLQVRWDLSRAREGRLREALDARRTCGCAVLSRKPAVLLVPIGGTRPLRMVESLSSFLADRSVLFLLLIYWSLENPPSVAHMRRHVDRHRARFPNHHLVFLCNTAEEERLLDAAGIEAIFVNQNQIVSEHVFRPLPNPTAPFDAVYNAKLARFKRHYLAAAIERVLYIAYRCPHDLSRTACRAYVRRMLAQSPQHRFANRLVDGLPERLTPAQVNEGHNQASVGLCLSPIEGAMYVSMEYLLAGLPIVTTPSRGGRDFFFDPDYCLTADADPRAIRDAVVALRDRAIPRQVVRQRTLERVEAARRRSRTLIENVLARHGMGLDASAIWPPEGRAHAIAWKPVRSHIADYFAAQAGSELGAAAA